MIEFDDNYDNYVDYLRSQQSLFERPDIGDKYQAAYCAFSAHFRQIPPMAMLRGLSEETIIRLFNQCIEQNSMDPINNLYPEGKLT